MPMKQVSLITVRAVKLLPGGVGRQVFAQLLTPDTVNLPEFCPYSCAFRPELAASRFLSPPEDRSMASPEPTTRLNANNKRC